MIDRTGFRQPVSDSLGQNLRAEIRRLILESKDTQDNPARSMEFGQRAFFLAEEGGRDYEAELANGLRQRGVLSSLISDYNAALTDDALYYHAKRAGSTILGNIFP